MQVTYYSKDITVTDSLKSSVENALSCIEKYETKHNITVNVKFKTYSNTQKVEFTVYGFSNLIRVEESNKDMYKAILKAGDVLKRKLRKLKEKNIDKYHKRDSIKIPTNDVSDTSSYDIKYKTFEKNTLTIEDAIDEMEFLGHNFYLFINNETNNPCLVYKRTSTGYGFIELV